MTTAPFTAYVNWPSAPLTDRLVRAALEKLQPQPQIISVLPSPLGVQNLLQWSTYDALDHDITLFWSTRDPMETYGPEIRAIIEAMGHNAHIHNTTTMGRPDTLPTVLDLYKTTQSEAVIVISNPKLTIDLVLDLEALGVPAFGPIWDS